MPFSPQYVFFEKASLDYPLGQRIYRYFQQKGQEVLFTDSHNRVRGLPGSSPGGKFAASKKTLVVGVRKTLDFSSCKPSAHFQLPLVTGCPGFCQYCYLHTTLGARPYLRIYVNLKEILEKAQGYIKERVPEETIFEGSATSDPLAVEYLSGSLGKAVEFFAANSYGRFRFVTKQAAVEPLLQINHKGRTRIRFSLNPESLIKKYEKGVPSLISRIKGAKKIMKAGYPAGFLIAPVFIYPDWQNDYQQLFTQLVEELGPWGELEKEQLTFEFVTHRFTSRAKKNILGLFPSTMLPMEEGERKFKYGQFGYGKYVYPPELMVEAKKVLQELVEGYFPGSKIEYIV